MFDLSSLLAKFKKPEKKFYLTKEGLEKIKKDYQNLVALKHAKTNGETPEFLHSDELNPEYLDFQDDMSLLEAKLADLEYVIKNSELIKPPLKELKNTVQVGAKVWFEMNGEKDEFTVVGSLEADPSQGRISNESPVGQAILGRKVGEDFVVDSPAKTTYKIKKIKYEKA